MLQAFLPLIRLQDVRGLRFTTRMTYYYTIESVMTRPSKLGVTL